MHLVTHLVSSPTIFDNLTSREKYNSNIISGLKIAVEATTTGTESPYLLHALLAFSARHLAHLHPSQSAAYLHQAVTLQTEAISLFNQSHPPLTSSTPPPPPLDTTTPANPNPAPPGGLSIDSANCVPVILFSSVLGHHLLADTLFPRDPSLDSFLARWSHCASIHQGVKAVAVTAWPLLMESPIAEILSSSRVFTSQDPRGHQCDCLTQMIDASPPSPASARTLDESQKQACRQVVRYLQIGVDAALPGDQSEPAPGDQHLVNKHQMIFSWVMMVPAEFTAMLTAKQPEALILLGYYALLLHYGRQMWQIGDAGRYILGMVVDYLPPQWHHWLEWPRKVLYKDEAVV